MLVTTVQLTVKLQASDVNDRQLHVLYHGLILPSTELKGETFPKTSKLVRTTLTVHKSRCLVVKHTKNI
jgi:hypothetical protein